MFNFTSTTFIHSTDQFEACPNHTQGTLRVNGVNLFKKEDIVGIYRNPYTAPVNGLLRFNTSKAYLIYESMNNAIDNSTHFRINFYLRRSGDNNSYYANDMVFKGKDFHYEWTGRKDGTQLVKLFKKINKLYGDVFLNIHTGTTSSSSDNSKIIEFESDNYGLFTEAVVEVWEDVEPNCCFYTEGKWKVLDRIDLKSRHFLLDGEENCTYLDKNSTAENISTTPRAQKDKWIESNYNESVQSLQIRECTNGCGTYWQVMKDLRLPTAENDGPWSITQQQMELPVPGNMYVQYTLHYVSCRGVLGGSAVGEVTHSKTTHVFFVPADCCPCPGTSSGIDSSFLEAIKDAGLANLLVDVEAGVIGDGKRIAEKVDPTVNPITATQPLSDSESFAITNNTTSQTNP